MVHRWKKLQKGENNCSFSLTSSWYVGKYCWRSFKLVSLNFMQYQQHHTEEDKEALQQRVEKLERLVQLLIQRSKTEVGEEAMEVDLD